MNRQDFLNQIRQSHLRALLPDAQFELMAERPLPPFKPQDLQDAFTEEATVLKAHVHSVGSVEQAYDAIGTIFDLYDAKSYLRWDNLPLSQLDASLSARGCVLADSNVPFVAEARTARLLELERVQIGVTGALAGLADNGGLVMRHGAGNGRLASLIPPIHIAILRAENLFPDMAHFLQAHPQVVAETSNFVLICGPSRTADIEQTLTIGVHGPKELHIILLT